MLDEISGEAKDQMEKAIETLKKQLSVIRAGRANVAMLDGIRVDYYGNPSPLNQVASVTVADARSARASITSSARFTSERVGVTPHGGRTTNHDTSTRPRVASSRRDDR